MNELSSVPNVAVDERRESIPPPIIINTAPPAPPAWRRSRFWLGLLLGLMLAWGGPYLWRPAPMLDTAPVHPDRTEVVAPIKRQVPAKVALAYQNRNGELVRVLADAGQYSAFVRAHAASLEQSRQQLRQQAQARFEAGMDAIFQDPRQRVPVFADWYYGYGTNYQLLWEALTSAVRHLGDGDVKERVAADLERVLQQHYELLVLKPEITDPRLQQLYRDTLEQARQSYLEVLATMQAEFQVFVARHTTHLDPGQPPAAELRLDWPAQLHKVRIASDANSTLGAFRGITLTTLGAAAGKVLGGQVGAAIAARLSLPFVERALLLVTGGAAGGTGGSLGGPLGAAAGVVIGAGAGLAVDWLIQEGIELLARDNFEAEIQAALASTQREWQGKLLPPLLGAVDAWVDDTIQLLPQFKP
ncbi:MAG: hypothetical protein P9E24_09145 [Candidatus Competibacter sp.]|nr:hypothetical protein [Candidatus Competibacter sp.]MDG4582914.1 hypothetical protein [Candidatus Competibacter sp.]